jgi:hypothetical protein
LKLGLGESWKALNLATDDFSPCTYTGAKAKAEFAAITGCSVDIPLEENVAPFFVDCKLWDPYVFVSSFFIYLH